MKLWTCLACQAKDQELAFLRKQVTDLTQRLTAIVDVRAEVALSRLAKERTPTTDTIPGNEGGLTEDRPRPRLRYPAGIQTLVGDGHVDLNEERRRAAEDRVLRGRVPPPVIRG